MKLNRFNDTLIVVNPLGLILALVDGEETQILHRCTNAEYDFIHQARANYDQIMTLTDIEL